MKAETDEELVELHSLWELVVVVVVFFVFFLCVCTIQQFTLIETIFIFYEETYNLKWEIIFKSI